MTRKKTFLQKHGYALFFSLALVALTGFVLLDTFVLPHAVSAVAVTTAVSEETVQTIQSDTQTAAQTTAVNTASSAQQSAAETETATEAASDEVIVTDDTYSGNGIRIAISTVRTSGTTAYIADVQLTSAESLKTALAQNTFGSNITQTTSEMAEANSAILAINGDYYGANKRGYVIKNGVLYRDTVRQGDDTEDLAIYADGTFAIIDESEITAQALLDSGVVQLLSFGPTLIENGEIQVSSSDEVSRAKTSNPRTAIGIIDDLHYIIVVADGRTSESDGLSLLELAQLMESYGCTTAYNLDGGGSSTMVFNGTVINKPTTNGNDITERSVSDIVYIAA
ncbi:MAG TPA: phosphodiester glycosidase family protein [Clostridia bacterium]|nr:phosphodiester glycosidase family protein [Clostridia bacterium]